MPDPLIWACRSLYNWCQRFFYIASSKSGSFPMRVGLSLFVILFITFMDRISRHSQGVKGIPLVTGCIWSKCYDIDLIKVLIWLDMLINYAKHETLTP